MSKYWRNAQRLSRRLARGESSRPDQTRRAICRNLRKALQAGE